MERCPMPSPGPPIVSNFLFNEKIQNQNPSQPIANSQMEKTVSLQGVEMPYNIIFFSSSFSHAFFRLIPGRGFTTSTSSKQEMTKFSLSEGKRISSKEKFPCSQNTPNSLFSTHVQALTWGRKKPLNWCCNLIPSFVFSKFHLTAHIFSLAYFFSQALRSVLSKSLQHPPLLNSYSLYFISWMLNIARQLTDYQTQHARKQFLLFLRKIA